MTHPAKYIALLLTFLLAACNFQGASDKAGGAAKLKTIKVTGELRSANSRYYGPPRIHGIWQYTISYMVADGSKVRAGETMLKFDTQELEIQIRDKRNVLKQKLKELEKQQILSHEVLAENRMAVEEARSVMDKARLKADIPANLVAGQEYRKNQLELEQTDLTVQLREALLEKEARLQETESEILRREIALLEAEVSQLQDSVGKMNIAAPADGVVIHVLTPRGEKQAVGDNVWGGRRVLEFPDLSQLELHLEIPERQALQVTLGQPVSFTLDAAPDKPFEGQVLKLASVIRTKVSTQPAKVLDAVVSLENAESELMRPGMSVNAEIKLSDGMETDR